MGKEPPKKNWIKGAVKKPGAFGAWAKRDGEKGVNKKAINRGLHARTSHVRHMAQFAKNMQALAARRKAKGGAGKGGKKAAAAAAPK